MIKEEEVNIGIFPEREKEGIKLSVSKSEQELFKIGEEQIQQHSFKKLKKKPTCSFGVNFTLFESIYINLPKIKKKYRKHTDFVKVLSDVIIHEVLHVLINRESGIPCSQVSKRAYELSIYKLGY